MTKVNKRFRRHFGELSCEWCGRWSRIWSGVIMNPKNISRWREDYMPRVYQCKRNDCLSSRPEGWEEIETLQWCGTCRDVKKAHKHK